MSELCPDTQCCAISLLPCFYKGSASYPCCVKLKGHAGPHRTSKAYGDYEFESSYFMPVRAEKFGE